MFPGTANCEVNSFSGANNHRSINAQMMESSSDLPSKHAGYVSLLQLPSEQKLQQKYNCLYCARIFSTLKLLKQHIRIHTGEKPYVCRICLKPFTQFGNLRRHIRIHTGEKPFKCDLCDYRASQSDSLKSHIFTKHKSHFRLK